MTALQLCQRCGEGLTVHREGEPCPRCTNCGAPETCPVKGGQSRPASEILSTGLGCAWLAAAALLACIVGLVALAAGAL